MISRIQNGKVYSHQNINSVRSFKGETPPQNPTQKTDIFQRESSLYDYKVNKIYDGTYMIEDIAFAKEKMNSKDDKWKKELYEKTYKDLKDNRPPYEVMYEGIPSRADMNNTRDRILIGIYSFGINEIEIQMENYGFRKRARDKVRKMDLLIADLKDIKAQEDVAEIREREQYQKYKLKFMGDMNEAKEKQLKPKLLNLIQRQREGRDTDMPNCIMLTNKNDVVSRNLISWAGDNINGNFITIESNDDILQKLEEAEENYQETGDWNLMYIKGMDKLIDHSQTKDRVVESMKDIMSACAEDYHTIIIFSSTQPESLDKIALQPHRVKKINVEHIKTPKSMAIEDAKQRISDEKNVKFTPIKTINDLLLIAGADKSLRLTWNHTKEQRKEIDKAIKEKFTPQNNPKELEIYNLAVKNLI